MPELPEVETVARTLGPHLVGQVLRSFKSHWPKVLANIYVDETLWRAGIHPMTLTSDAAPAEMQRLHRAIQEVLGQAIQANGTTFLDFKFLGGIEGGYQESLRVFGRQGRPCPRCGVKIVKIRVARRGTHICPWCQRGP